MSQSLDRFTDTLLLQLMREAPDVAANLGIDSVAGVGLDPAGMPDFSPEGCARRQQLLCGWKLRFSQGDFESRDAHEAVTCAVLEHVFEHGVYSTFSGSGSSGMVVDPYPVTHISGVHKVLTALLMRDHLLNCSEDLDSFLSRLAQVAQVVDGAVETLQLRRSERRIAPVMSLALALEALEKFLAPPPEHNVWVLALRAKAQRSGIDSDHVNSAVAGACQIMQSEIYPAYSRLVSELRLHRDEEIQEPGTWRLDEGEAWYASRLKSCTTLPCDAELVHEVGLAEVGRVRRHILKAARTSGMVHRDAGEVLRWLEAQERKAVGDWLPSSALPRLRQIIEVSAERLRSLFTDWPDTEVTVEEIPESLMGSMYTHYVPGQTGSTRRHRHALLCVNTEQLRQLGEYAAPMLVYHEVFPGHHLQLSTAARAQHLSAFRRAMLFPGYLEGWAKYAERLGSEVVGLPGEGVAVLAQLRQELYSTANLVLDTGLHHRRWSAQQGIEYFVSQTGAPPAIAETMVARSAAAPAQLTAYKMGMMSFDAAMTRMRRALGSSFRPRTFHDRVLSLGAVPLPVLEAAADSVGSECEVV